MKSLDYNDFTIGEEKKAQPAKKQLLYNPTRWWLATDDLLPSAIMNQVATIIKADSGRIDSYNKYAKLYGTFTPTFWNGYGLANSGKAVGPVQDRLTYNIVQSCTDTLTSMMVQNKPKPMFLTSAGDSTVQRRAKKLDAYCYGTFYQNKLYELGPIGFRDSCVFGEGIIHPYIQAGKMKYERVMPYEILTDYLESHSGPRATKTLHRLKNIDRTELCEAFPEHRDAIWTMPGTAYFISASNRSIGDTVTVIESWRLPVGEDPGLTTIITPDLLLHKDVYEEEFFPFSIQRYCPRLYGFYGQSLAEQLVPTQFEINRTLISIQRSLYMGGTHKIFLHNSSKVVKSHFDNLVGTIITYSGDKMPQYVVPQLVQPEIYAHLNSMIGQGYQLPGISQMGATSMKTPGVNSGRAMRTEQNINTQRHQTLDQGYQNAYVDLAQITVAVARKQYKSGGDLKPVKIPGKRFIETIDWNDCSLEDDQFVLQIYPVSKLPNDPEGRIATVTEMMEGGLMSPEVGRRVLDFPDLEAEENLANASQDYLHKILDDIVDHGKYTAPEPDDNLVVAKKLCLEYLAQGKLNNLSDKKIQMLRTFNQQIMILEPKPAPEQPVQAPADPLPTPTSELLPNVNMAAPV